MRNQEPTRLQRTRFERGLTQWQVARRARLPASKLSLIERGQLAPNPVERRRLAETFGLSEEQLFGPEEGSAVSDVLEAAPGGADAEGGT